MTAAFVLGSLLVFTAAAVALMRRRETADAEYHSTLRRSILLHSDAFAEGGRMPDAHTFRGEGASPPLAWTGVPPGTKSLVLLVTDEDLPSKSFPLFKIVHWGLYDIPAASGSLAQGVTEADWTAAGISAIRGWGGRRYLPPRPASGNHRYAFRIYALDAERLDGGIRSRAALLRAMQGRILAYGELNGRCER